MKPICKECGRVAGSGPVSCSYCAFVRKTADAHQSLRCDTCGTMSLYQTMVGDANDTDQPRVWVCHGCGEAWIVQPNGKLRAQTDEERAENDKDPTIVWFRAQLPELHRKLRTGETLFRQGPP